MYPNRDLAGLAARKAIVHARIEVRRWECAAAFVELSRPIAMVDRGIEAWRKISPFVKMIGLPVGLLGLRKVLRRGGRGKWSKIAAMMPAILRGAKMVMQMRGARNGATAGTRSGV
jgi:hypothetical protein